MKHLPNGYKLTRVHLHQGNSSKRARHGHPYVTISTIRDEDGGVMGKGVARCSRQDNPSRIIGRTLADARAVEQMYKVESLTQ